MGSLWPKSGLIERDNNDDRAIGAKVYFYDAGTSTPKTVYQDSGESTAHTNPVSADGNGRWPAIYIPFGAYKERRTTTAGAAIGDTIDNIPNEAPFDDSVVTDPLDLYDTGDIISRLTNATKSGFVRLNGRTIGNASSSATERANADCEDLFAHIWNACADGQAAVSGGRGGSAAADFAANKRIALPDWRAVGPVGFDDMGNTAASLLGSAPVVSGSTILPGSILGANTHTLLTAQLPVTTPAGTNAQVTGTISQVTPAGTIAQITPTGTVATTVTNQGVSGVLSLQTGGLVVAGGSGWTAVVLGATSTFTGTPFTPVFTGTPVTPTFTGSTPTFTGTAFGSGSAHNNLARAGLVTFYIKL